jgi:hypothetical protein
MSVASLRFMRQLNRRLERQQAIVPELAPSSELQTIEAADFVSGGEANFARAANAKGAAIATWQAGADESHVEFVSRARRSAKAMNAARLVIGGIPELAHYTLPDVIRPAPHGAVALPDGALHSGQRDALRTIQSNRFVALRCGRRFGKSSLCAAVAADVAMLGAKAGLFAPIFRLCAPLFDILSMMLAPILASSNRSQGELRVVGGGGVDVWSLERPAAGRGQHYRTIVVDEAAHGGDQLTQIWAAAMRPTLADSSGPAIFASTPFGVAESNLFWRACNVAEMGFVEYVAPTSRNPFIPASELEALRATHNPAVYAQEFLAEFVNLAGVGLFDVAKMLNAGEPWETPERFDVVFATLDSGVKGGQEHDASAIVYFGLNAAFAPLGLFVIGWEAVELGAGNIELWFAEAGRKLDEYAKHARMGSRGVHVEAAGLGEMLLAKAASLGVDAIEIKSEHVSRGKDLRALSVEGLINGGKVRLTAPACEKTSRLKGVLRNHLLYQIASFRIADKDAWKRSDDLTDALVYGALIAYRNDG